MKNLQLLRKKATVLVTILILLLLGFALLRPKAVTNPTHSLTEFEPISTTEPEPKKEFSSLDNYIEYAIPKNWHKEDHVDTEYGNYSYLYLISPDFDSPETFLIKNGIRVSISRGYTANAEQSLSNRLNAEYESYDYDIAPLKINGKNAMTMHEDYEGHNRFIYIADKDYLWQISLSSKSLEDEAKYKTEIDNFLSSIKFK